MQFVLVLSCIIGFGIGSKMGIMNWILSIIGIITLPIIPLAYCGILSMIMMAFTKLVRSKDLILFLSKLSVKAVFLLCQDTLQSMPQ